MPQERDSQYPMPTSAEVDAAPGAPATKTARNIAVRHITGIPRRGFLMGDNDCSPVMRGIADLTSAALALLDVIPADQKNGTLRERAVDLHDVLHHHGCPDAAPLIDKPE